MNLRGKGLFVFSDPGGAKPILVLAQKHAAKAPLQVWSDRTYDFFGDFDLDVQHVSLSSGNLERQIEASAPDFLFVGTSYTSKLEVACLKQLVGRVPTYAFVDHYTRMQERFIWQNEMVIPDAILVIDEKAKQIAIAEGLPEDALQILAHPYHAYLKTWTPSIARAPFLAALDLNPQAKTILFAPDPLTNAGGRSVYGFDEYDGLAALEEATSGMDHLAVLLRMHPNQARPQMLAFVSARAHWHDAEAVHLNTLIYHADVVVSFFSNLLKEAYVMGKTVFQLRLPSSTNKFMRLDDKIPVVSPTELRKILGA